jgi:hypothetical protein
MTSTNGVWGKIYENSFQVRGNLHEQLAVDGGGLIKFPFIRFKVDNIYMQLTIKFTIDANVLCVEKDQFKHEIHH